MSEINRRRNSILDGLINGTYKSLEDYAKIFEVSERTIRSDLKEINCTLKEKQQPLIQINETGKICFTGNGEIDKVLLWSLMREKNFYTYKLSPSERKTILAMLLMNKDSYITIASLTELVFMSRNTLLNDLDELKEWFCENNMKLVSQTRRGFMISGTEKNIRSGMLKLLLLNGDLAVHEENFESDTFKALLLQEFNQNELISEIESIIKTMEEQNNVRLADFSFRELVYYIVIMVNRLLKNKCLSKVNKTEWNKLKKSSKWNMAVGLMDMLCDKFCLPVLQQETADLVETLRSKSYIKNNGRSIDMIDIRILINEFIFKISNSLHINYYLDFYLYDLLIDHMKTAVYRLRQGHSIKNTLLSQLEDMYPYIFDEAEKHIKSLEEYMKQRFTRDELSFIVMYIVSVIEKNISRNIVINAVLVCNTGRGTAQMISARLQSLFNQIKIIDIISSHNINGIQDKNPDVIISTVPLKETKIPYLQISPIMAEEDYYKIQRLAMDIQDKKQNDSFKNEYEYKKAESFAVYKESLFHSEYQFIDILTTDRMKLGVDAEDWKEAVRKAGEILYQKNKIEKGYIEAMISNIEKNGPYVVIYPGIAIPHATPSDGTIEVAASLIRLNKPVCFNHDLNDPVNYVIALSIMDSDSIDRPLYNLTKMLGTGTFLEDINKAVTETELLDIIKKYEKLIQEEVTYERIAVGRGE